MRPRGAKRKADASWLLQPAVRGLVEQAIQNLIDALDAADAAAAEREPDDEDEIVSEDDAVIPEWRSVGRQWS